MGSFRYIFGILICLLVRESFQNVETFNENITAVYNASSPPTSGIELSTQPTETKCDYIDTEIAADTNSSVTIRCESNDRDFTVEWLDVRESYLRRIELISGNSTTVSKLTIFLASKSDTGIYSCRRSKNLIERFHLRVLDPKITILDKSSIFVKQGGPINLSCSITARQYSPDQVKWYHNGTLIESHQTNWRLKNRTCTADDEEHCTIETLFSLNVKDTDYKSSGNFSCATDVLEPATVYVEILTHVVLLESTMHDFMKAEIFEIATNALTLYGVQKSTAEYIKRKCIEDVFSGVGHCSCVLGREPFEYAAAMNLFVSFRLGSIYFAVWHHYK